MHNMNGYLFRDRLKIVFNNVIIISFFFKINFICPKVKIKK